MNNFRTNNKENPSGWNNGDWASPITKKDGTVLTQMEVNTQAANIWVLEQFVIPNIDKVKSITITQKKVSNTNGAIWFFPYDYPTENSYNAEYVENVKTVLGVYPGNTYMNTPTIDDVSSATVSLGDINDIKTTYASYITDNTLTLNLLLTTKTGATSKGIFYTQNTENEGNRPYITVTYEYAAYNATTGTGYDNLKGAIDAATVSSDIYLYDDCTLTGRATTAATGLTLNIIPMNDVTIAPPTDNRSTMWVLCNKSGTTLNIGSDDHTITFKSSGSSRIILNNVCAAEAGTLNLTNVVFDNIQFSGEASNKIGKAIYYKSGSTGTLRNVSFMNCTISPAGDDAYTPKALIYNENTSNDKLFFDKSLYFDSNCSAPHIYATGRMRMTEADRTAFAYNEPIQILWGGTTNVGTNVVVRISGSYKDAFQLANGNYMSLAINTNNWTDLFITQTYPLNVSDAGAATLILPFETTIPNGVSVYTLNYNGGDVVTATLVETTLPANTPVLVNAEAGNYTFATTATSGDVATGSDPITVGALTGVYETTVVPTGSFILTNATSGVGFRKVDGTTNKVGANRAYLTADGAGARLSIVYGEEATGIESMNGNENVNENVNAVYDIQGRRVAHPTRGLYIVNGKKVMVK